VKLNEDLVRINNAKQSNSLSFTASNASKIFHSCFLVLPNPLLN